MNIPRFRQKKLAQIVVNRFSFALFILAETGKSPSRCFSRNAISRFFACPPLHFLVFLQEITKLLQGLLAEFVLVRACLNLKRYQLGLYAALLLCGPCQQFLEKLFSRTIGASQWNQFLNNLPAEFPVLLIANLVELRQSFD